MLDESWLNKMVLELGSWSVMIWEFAFGLSGLALGARRRPSVWSLREVGDFDATAFATSSGISIIPIIRLPTGPKIEPNPPEMGSVDPSTVWYERG